MGQNGERLYGSQGQGWIVLMVLLVLSCDKNTDIFDAFRHCLEKYWKDHPDVIYAMETKQNPYYKTICHEADISVWTKRIRATLEDIDDDQILLIMDDFFIRQPVDTKRIEYLSTKLSGNIAHFCFEKSYDPNDAETDIEGMKRRQHGSMYEVCLNCGLWQKDKLIDVLSRDTNPWDIEINQDNRGYDYYINSGDYIVDWGYVTWVPTGLFRGKWCRNIIPFFESEGIEMDYSKRGFYGE